MKLPSKTIQSPSDPSDPSGWIAWPQVVAPCIGDGGAQTIRAKTRVPHLGAGTSKFGLRICEQIECLHRFLAAISSN